MSDGTRIIVHLTNDLLEAYQAQSVSRSMKLEDLIEERLKSCVNHRSDRSLYFTSEQKTQLEVLLNKPLMTASQVLEAVGMLVSLKIAGINVNLEPQLIDRLKSRNFTTNFSEFVHDRVVEGLETYVGLR